MSRTQPQGRWRWSGLIGPVTTVPLPRLCAMTLVGAVVWIGLASVPCVAQSGSAGGASGYAGSYGSSGNGVGPAGTVPRTYGNSSGPIVPPATSNRTIGTLPRVYSGANSGPIVRPMAPNRSLGVVPSTYTGINNGPVVPPTTRSPYTGTVPGSQVPRPGSPTAATPNPVVGGAPLGGPQGPTVSAPTANSGEAKKKEAQRMQELLRSGPVVAAPPANPPATTPAASPMVPADPNPPVVEPVPIQVVSRPAAPGAGAGARVAGPTMLVAPGERVQLPPSILAASAEPVTLTPPTVPGASRASTPRTGGTTGSSAALTNGTSPVGPTQVATRALMAHASGTTERELIAGRPGLTLWNEPQLAMQYAKSTTSGAATEIPEPEGPWTLGGDLEKYRAHAVKEGSRDSGESLKKALERAGMTLGDGVNVFVLGYASDRAKPFRANDGKGLLQEPGKVPQRAGETIGSLGYTLYSIADVATLNSLPDIDKPAYKDNNPLVRPVLFAGRTIGGAWKTTEEVGNALTWGLFDNVTGCIGLVIEDLVELVKHAGEAVTNVVRAPFHLAAGKKPHEGTDQALDWVLLVPLELASNAAEMKGFSNMEDYKRAFADKGVIGSILEFGGSTYIVYRAVDEALDRLKNDKPSQNQNSGGGQSGEQPPSEPPTTPGTPEPPVVETPPDAWIVFGSDGNVIDWSYWY